MNSHPLWGGVTANVATVNRSLPEVADLIVQRTNQLARERDEYCGRLLVERLPARLHFLLGHPKALKLLLRLVPRWRGTLTVVQIRPEAGAPNIITTREGAEHFAQTWLA